EIFRILRQSSDDYDWVGIYLLKDDVLELAAYEGDSETEHVRIPIGQGICGSAAKEGDTILVPDVNKDPRYLACFASTRSEIVVPIIGRKAVLGEIDIDSDRPSAFDAEDQQRLEDVARKLAAALEN
ncbi:MAG TPA: GAF domain-containing protein, partial [Candidatus Bathyarchaeia archaeon]|nr:GAF domain-containing protein [Candidatus Bathyarchaeia archaeon]